MVGSRSIPVNGSALLESEPRSKSMPRLSTSSRVEPFPFDVPKAAGSRSGISGPTLMWSGFDRDNGALDRHHLDRKLSSTLRSSALRDNAGANAKARYAALQQGFQVSLLLVLDLAASVRCRQQTALALQAIRLFLRPRTPLANVAMLVSRYSTPRLDHN